MEAWYAEYFAQTWYRNSFLVRKPDQIAQAIGHEKDWNNIYDSGCNFTCLAMIVGVDPARLASVLGSMSFFSADRDMPAKYLTTKTGGLVWDQNAPHTMLRLKNFWHSRLQRRTTITINFKGEITTADYAEGKRIVHAARTKGLHVICGPEEHSHLVAGKIGRDFIVWDPDDSVVSVEDNLAGRLTLKRLFKKNEGRQIEFWMYQVDFL